MSMHDDVLDTAPPTPQDYGFPANPSTVNRRCWDRQELFLQAFSQLGTILHAARVVGIHRTTVNLWLSADLYSFKTRFELAHQDYQEFLEGLIHERLVDPQGNRGSDILLTFKAKAEMPEKYREEVKVLGMEGPKEMLVRLKELADRDRKAREEAAALEPPAIEGAYREVEEAGQALAVIPTLRAEAPPEPPVGVKPILSVVEESKVEGDKKAAKVKANREAKGEPRRHVTRR
jgi:hypothetical protein